MSSRTMVTYLVLGALVAVVLYAGLRLEPAALDKMAQLSYNTEESSDIINTDNVNTSGLKIEDLVVGETGDPVKAGDLVTVNYTGTLTNGMKFDSSDDHGQPFSFTVGAGQVIKGWDLGVVGMKAGSTRKLTIPAELAYGAQEIKNPATGEILIPANSTLVFEVQVIVIASN